MTRAAPARGREHLVLTLKNYGNRSAQMPQRRQMPQRKAKTGYRASASGIAVF